MQIKRLAASLQSWFEFLLMSVLFREFLQCVGKPGHDCRTVVTWCARQSLQHLDRRELPGCRLGVEPQFGQLNCEVKRDQGFQRGFCWTTFSRDN
ncbi:hypothetical protein B0H19DRAFT_1150842 [Mycena capillaripes]|nr:hypothetical protein B0H19DRAFT_1150842 [Mycena capillaripes]